MRFACLPCLAFTVAFFLASAGAAEDCASLDGVWRPATAELAGKPFPEEVRKAMKLVIEGEKYTVTVGETVDRGTVQHNAAAEPRELDITGVEGPNAGKTILAIYECDGDTLRVCYDLGGQGRPKEFASAEGTLRFLVTYEREKR